MQCRGGAGVYTKQVSSLLSSPPHVVSSIPAEDTIGFVAAACGLPSLQARRSFQTNCARSLCVVKKKWRKKNSPIGCRSFTNCNATYKLLLNVAIGVASAVGNAHAQKLDS